MQVSDFGLSRQLIRTTAGNMQGTYLWAAPEVLAGKCLSLKSDTWSYGCTVVEMLSEKDPYHHKLQGNFQKMNAVIRQVEKGKLVSINKVKFGVRILALIWI